MVLGSLTRRAVVAVARGERRPVKGLDGRVAADPEREVHVRARITGHHGEGASLADVLDPLGRVMLQPDPDVRRHGLPEGARGGEILRSQPEMIVLSAPERRVADRFDAVAVGVEDEAAVVVLPVLGSRRGVSGIAVPGSDQPRPPRVDRCRARSLEPKVQVARRLADGDREAVPLEELLALVRRLAQREAVEPAARVAVGDSDRHVVEHPRRF